MQMLELNSMDHLMALRLQKNLHFIGIGGTGMRPLAEIALHQGYTVTGSDQSTSVSTDFLSNLGAKIAIGHSPEALPSAKEVCVIVSSAIKDDNLELKAAEEKSYPIIHRSDLLAALMQGYKSICVSGTHGKTSTTAMLAYMLESLGLDPIAAVGGEIVGRESYALTGKGRYFVAECDESDGTFLKYNPFISVITNIDLDHLDFYKDLEGLKAGFLSFMEKTDPEGWSIVGWDNPSVREIAHQFQGQRLSFGNRIGCEVRGLKFKNEGRLAQYEAVVDKTLVHDFAPLVGKHSFQNILCCLAVTQALELDVQRAAQALRTYPGVKRRFSLIAEVGHVKIFDDYAHNPGKIRSCIEGARDAFPHERIIVIFQPHRYSRLETMYNELMGSFAAADQVFVLPVYAAGEVSLKEFSPQSIAADMSRESRVPSFEYKTDLIESLLREPKPTVIITIGAGDVSRLSTEWKDRLNEQTAQEERTPISPKA